MALQVVSVMPQPCLRLTCPSGQSAFTSSATDWARGAAPELAPRMLERLYFLTPGCLASATAMGGARVKLVILKSWMCWSILMKSNLGMI